jgi:hypothetical protein
MMDQDDRLLYKKKRKEQGDATNSSGNDEPAPFLAPSLVGRENMEIEDGLDEQMMIDHEYEERSRDSGVESRFSESDDSDDEDEDGEDEDEEEHEESEENDVDEEVYDPDDYYCFAEFCLQIARNDATLVELDTWCSDLVWNDTNIFLLGNALIGNTHLRLLRVTSTLARCDYDGGIRALCNGITQSQLHTLKMNSMGDRVQKNFFQEIEKLTTLRHLMIQETKFDLSTLTKPNQFLTHLTLRECELEDNDMMALSKWIFGHSNLLSLELPENSITDVGVNYICEHWKTDAPLQALQLQTNCFGSDGAHLLMREASRHSNFCSLDMGDNPAIGQRGLQLIGQELPAIGFTVLKLRQCCSEYAPDAVQDALCRALADGLRGNSTLARLDISDNPIGAKGAQMIMQAVAVHPSLESLSLVGDRTIGLAGIKLIGMELPHTKLKEISLCNCARGWSQSPAAITAGQALLDGVRLNETLLYFNYYGLPRIYHDPIQFFVKLNQRCRLLLRSDVVVPAVWPYIFEHFQVKNNLSEMYWSLQEQPWLITTGQNDEMHLARP